MSKKIGMISLGCPKNQVDAEIMLASLSQNGFEITNDVDGADAVIINTCGFIETAKKEAIENILDMVQLKTENVIGKIIVTGCLVERYKDEILTEIPEIDAVVGLGANGDICDVCNRVLNGETVKTFPEKTDMPICGERLLTTPPYMAYLKIAEGCSNNCTYCAIPSIRGAFRSRPPESILKEAQDLAKSGVKELIVVAQDTTRYGEDLYGKSALPALLTTLAKIEEFEWIRVLYCYSERITDELIDTIAENEKLVNYFDIPIQHADADILKRMNRKGDKESLLALIAKIRSKIPDVVLRTTLITGFPGETEESFNELSDFVEKAKFDRLGCFAYSAEEGTPAASFPNQVDEEVKTQRGDIIMEQQYRIFDAKNKANIGKIMKTVVEGYDAYTDSYFGRTYRDAPDIDGQVLFTCGYELNDGDFVDVEIFDVSEYDLIGEVV
ncbi:MAG: 30S ribosomal protein S12 methylthiotransferase RimO [Oscillospiraceae bacterium]